MIDLYIIEKIRLDQEKFIRENKEKGYKKLKKNGWKIINTREYLGIMYFKILKNSDIHEVSLEEALNF